jgi:hypothetical protein
MKNTMNMNFLDAFGVTISNCGSTQPNSQQHVVAAGIDSNNEESIPSSQQTADGINKYIPQIDQTDGSVSNETTAQPGNNKALIKELTSLTEQCKRYEEEDDAEQAQNSEEDNDKLEYESESDMDEDDDDTKDGNKTPPATNKNLIVDQDLTPQSPSVMKVDRSKIEQIKKSQENIDPFNIPAKPINEKEFIEGMKQSTKFMDRVEITPENYFETKSPLGSIQPDHVIDVESIDFVYKLWEKLGTIYGSCNLSMAKNLKQLVYPIQDFIIKIFSSPRVGVVADGISIEEAFRRKFAPKNTNEGTVPRASTEYRKMAIPKKQDMHMEVDKLAAPIEVKVPEKKEYVPPKGT